MDLPYWQTRRHQLLDAMYFINMFQTHCVRQFILLIFRSAFFFFCGEHRADIKARNPEYSVGDIAKELGKMWEKVGKAYVIVVRVV